MGFKCGIVGLPNVGKSTLFNALTNSNKAQAENFPFCTIDPNIGIVAVPDERLDKLAEISISKKKINTTISIDAIIHMIRCFDSDDIQNVNPTVDPVRDLEIIETEMKLADLESIQKRLDKKNKKNVDIEELKLLEEAQKIIDEDGDLSLITNEFNQKLLKNSGLLSTKPKLYVCNVDEESIKSGNKYTEDFIKKFDEKNTLVISADIENQINQLEDENEKKNYMKMINMSETGLNSLIRKKPSKEDVVYPSQ